MTALIIRGGTVIDSTGTRTEDVGVVDDRIVDVAAAPDSATVIDATGCVVSTGLVDLHAKWWSCRCPRRFHNRVGYAEYDAAGRHCRGR